MRDTVENELLKAHMELALTKIDALAARIEKPGNEKDKAADEKDKPWWTSATAFLALPTAALGLWIAFNQITQHPFDLAKTTAETAKIRSEDTKLRLDIQAQLEAEVAKLREVHLRGTKETDAQLQEAVASLSSHVSRLAELDKTAHALDVSVLYKALVVGTFSTCLFLMLSVLSATANWVQGVSAVLVQSVIRRKIDRLPYEAQEKSRWRAWERRIPFIVMTSSTLMSVLRITLEVVIFASLSVPLFDLAMQGLGSPLRFEAVWLELRALHFGAAFAKVTSALTL